MSGAGFDAERHLDAMAGTLGLTVTEAQREGVLRFLSMAHRMAEILDAAPVPADTLELANVYHPPEAGA
ncbi:MAG: DUF4089 domain-containing protein [Pseudomonadota bacterium]|nr:DUF4089 domain-containing protein [Pseudomonadota bacterium]